MIEKTMQQYKTFWFYVLCKRVKYTTTSQIYMKILFQKNCKKFVMVSVYIYKQESITRKIYHFFLKARYS